MPVTVAQIQKSVLPDGASTEATLEALTELVLVLQQMVQEMRTGQMAFLPDAAGRSRIIAEGGTIAAVTTVTTATTVTNLTNAYDLHTGSMRDVVPTLHDIAVATALRANITVS